MKITKYLRIFSQVNFIQGLKIVVYLLNEKFYSKKIHRIRHSYELIHVLLYVFDNNFSIKKSKNFNILSVTDPDLGKYTVHLRRDSSDFGVFEQCLISKQYQVVVDLAKKNGINIHNIIDGGANIGCTTLFLKKHFPSSKIVSIELEKNNFTQLNTNVSLNKLQDVHLHNMALWNNDNEHLEIDNTYGDKRNWAFNVKPSLNASKETIKSITIKSILKDFSFKTIDILKLDIEGAEKTIFQDEDDVRSWLPVCKIIAIEFHDADTEAKTITLLNKYNFETFKKGELTIGLNKNDKL